MSFLWNPPAFNLNKLADLILEEKFTLQPLLRTLFSITLKKVGTEKFHPEDISRILNIYTQFFPFYKLQNILRSIDLVLLKNNGLGGTLETKGELLEKAGNNKKALEVYTLALCFAPTEDEDTMVRIYMKRAAILVRMDKYDLAIKDIDRALRYGKSKELEAQLSDGKRTCEAMIVPKVMGEQDLMDEKYRDQIISRVDGEELNQISDFPNFVSVNYHPYKGRYLVTNVDLEPGTTVLVEEPFVSVVEGHLKWQTKRCTHCLKETLNPIPCERCVFYNYCGEDCRIKDYERGHEFECPIMPVAHSMKLTKVQHMALKGICTAGPTVLKELYDKSRRVDHVEDNSTTSAENVNRNRYFQFSSMASHDRPSDMPYIALLAISIAHALRFKTSFFDKIEKSEIQEFEKFIAKIFLDHSKSIPYNTVALTATEVEIQDIPTYLENLDGRRLSQVASGIYPLINHFNHSCGPTTFRQHLPRGRVAIITNRQLKKGDELSHSYGVGYQRTPINERRELLAQKFRFNCECIACTENWPLITEMDTLNDSTFVCAHCESHIVALLSKHYISDVQEEFLNCELCIGKSGETSEPCNPFSLILDIGSGLLLKNRPVEAVPLLKECINYFQNNSTQPTLQLIQAQARLKDAYALICTTVTDREVIPAAKEESKNEDVPEAGKGYSCCIS